MICGYQRQRRASTGQAAPSYHRLIQGPVLSEESQITNNKTTVTNEPKKENNRTEKERKICDITNEGQDK